MLLRHVSMSMKAAAGLSLLVLPASLSAGTVYTYTGKTTSTLNGTGAMSIALDLTLTGAALDNLAPGTDVSAELNSFTMTDGGPPPQDNLGFASTDFSLTSVGAALPARVVEIGTDALGNITSWDISQPYFISFPAVPGEDPTDFYANYNIVSTTAGDNTQLLLDNDAGLAPGSSGVAAVGSWSPTAVPEPTTVAVFGIPAAMALLRRRRVI